MAFGLGYLGQAVATPVAQTAGGWVGMGATNTQRAIALLSQAQIAVAQAVELLRSTATPAAAQAAQAALRAAQANATATAQATAAARASGPTIGSTGMVQWPADPVRAMALTAQLDREGIPRADVLRRMSRLRQIMVALASAPASPVPPTGMHGFGSYYSE